MSMPDFGPKVANHEHVVILEERVANIEQRIEILYDLIEELAKKI